MTGRGKGLRRMRRWFDTLTASRRELARTDPGLLATYVQLLAEHPTSSTPMSMAVSG